MRLNLLLFVFTFLFASINAQENINLNFVSNLAYNEDLSDIWGYAAADGTEYAIVGTATTTSIVSLEDPANPVEVHSISGSNSVWRDMKNWGDFVYVTTDTGSDGLLIIDMSGAPNNITSRFWTPFIDPMNGGTSGVIGRCHNLYIDEQGYVYLSGCPNINSGGVIIFDAFTTPGDPVFVGAGQAVYSHDNYARGDTLWSSDINSGFFSVQDVSDKTNTSTLATQTTTTVFTHNAWLSDDGKYLFTTDEKPNAFVDAYDVSDLDDIKLLDSYQPQATKNKGVIPHNTHYEDGYLITSWYTDGVVIFDAHKPDNLVQVAAYDTYLGPDGGFSGCWGAYPYLPSGLILASDINSGLYVLQPDFKRACYLEGLVTDADDGTNISGALVKLDGFVETQTNSDFMGNYKTGYANAGDYVVQVSKSGYLPEIVPATLVNGEVTILNVQLTKAVPFSLDVKLINATNGAPIESGEILFSNDFENFDVTTNATGFGNIPAFIQGNYSVFAGAWGFLHREVDIDVDATTGTIEIMLTPGYQDDFIFDLGWTNENFGASSGDWERGVPIATSFGSSASNVNEDIEGDLGIECYMTDNRGGQAGAGDVDGGNVVLTSPVMDLTTYNEPVISYYTWFFNAGGSSAANDSLIVTINNGIESKVVEFITSSAGQWNEQTIFSVSDFLTPTDNVTICFRTMDQPNAGHIVEAGVDVFLVTEGLGTSVASPELSAELSASPNPFAESFQLNYNLEDGQANAQVIIHNALGQEVYREAIAKDFGTLDLGKELHRGVYFVTIANGLQKSKVLKLIKE